MAKPSRKWSTLSPAYRDRLRRAGVTPQQYNSGRVNLKAARGHATTPERPQRAFNRPDTYYDYLSRRASRGEPVPEDFEPRGKPRGGSLSSGRPAPWSVARIGNDIGYPSRSSISRHVIWRHPNKRVRDSGNVNADEATHIDLAEPDSPVTDKVYAYDERDFIELIRLVRKRGFVVRVESGQYEWRITT